MVKLIGAPKLVAWGEKIRKDRLKVWQETSPEIFMAVEAILARENRADWWITYKDKGLDVVCKLLLEGNLKKTAVPRQKPREGRK